MKYLKNKSVKIVSTVLFVALIAGAGIFLSTTDDARSGADKPHLTASVEAPAPGVENDYYAESKCGEGKCGEGKCGEGKGEEKKEKKEKGEKSESKCGEGKCGSGGEKEKKEKKEKEEEEEGEEGGGGLDGLFR